MVYLHLLENHAGCRKLWDLNAMKNWWRKPATDNQIERIRRRCKGFDTTGLNRGDASQILNRLFNAPKKRGRRSA